MKIENQNTASLIDELTWDPFVIIKSKIGLADKKDFDLLSRPVESYSKEFCDKTVPFDAFWPDNLSTYKTDAEIEKAVVNALQWQVSFENEKINIKVDGGLVKLEGEVEWEYQRQSAKNAIENLEGVKSVINLISIKAKVTAPEIQKKIIEAFHRNTTIDLSQIKTEIIGNSVTLTGTVGSYAEKEDASFAAWATPWVMFVTNKLTIKKPCF